MKQELIELKKLRNKQDTLKAEKEKLFEEFKQKNKWIFDELDNLNFSIEKTQGIIKNKALELFEKTGEKKLDYGVGIRVMKKLDYNESVAFDWAKSHNLALKLDKKKFEKIAKAEEIGFVKILEEPIATIPSKISIEE